MPEALLEHHVSTLRARGYVGLTFAESERRRRDGSLPARSVVVTFDDGYASTLAARSILDAAGYPATVFVLPEFAHSGARLCWSGIDHWLDTEHADELTALTWAELEALRDAGWEIGSHTLTHPRLPEIDDVRLADELDRSRREIADRLGACETLAYPYGLADDRVARAAERAGYVAACTLSTAHSADSPMLRPRVGLYPGDDGLRGRLKLSPAVLALRRTSAARLAQTLRSGRS